MAIDQDQTVNPDDTEVKIKTAESDTKTSELLAREVLKDSEVLSIEVIAEEIFRLRQEEEEFKALVAQIDDFEHPFHEIKYEISDDLSLEQLNELIEKTKTSISVDIEISKKITARIEEILPEEAQTGEKPSIISKDQGKDVIEAAITLKENAKRINEKINYLLQLKQKSNSIIANILCDYGHTYISPYIKGEEGQGIREDLLKKIEEIRKNPLNRFTEGKKLRRLEEDLAIFDRYYPALAKNQPEGYSYIDEPDFKVAQEIYGKAKDLGKRAEKLTRPSYGIEEIDFLKKTLGVPELSNDDFFTQISKFDQYFGSNLETKLTTIVEDPDFAQKIIDLGKILIEKGISDGRLTGKYTAIDKIASISRSLPRLDESPIIEIKDFLANPDFNERFGRENIGKLKKILASGALEAAIFDHNEYGPYHGYDLAKYSELIKTEEPLKAFLGFMIAKSRTNNHGEANYLTDGLGVLDNFDLNQLPAELQEIVSQIRECISKAPKNALESGDFLAGGGIVRYGGEEEILKLLGKISAYYIKQGGKETSFGIISLPTQIQDDLEEPVEAIAEQLKNIDSNPNLLKTFFKWATISGNINAAVTIFENMEQIKELVENTNGISLDSVLTHLTAYNSFSFCEALSKSPQAIENLEGLYGLNPGTVERDFLGSINLIRKAFPNFFTGFNLVSNGKLQNPYWVLKVKNSTEISSQDMAELLNKYKDDPEMAEVLLNMASATEAEFSDTSIIHPSAEQVTEFREALTTLAYKIKGFDEGSFQEEIFTSQLALKMLAKNPEKADFLLTLDKKYKELFDLLAPGGPLNANLEAVIKTIFESDRPEFVAHSIERIFKEKVPYWKQLWMYTEMLLSEKFDKDFSSKYPVREIGQISLESLVKEHQQSKQENSSVPTRLEKIVVNQEVLSRVVTGDRDFLRLDEIEPLYRKIIFRSYLRETIETSRSEEAKKASDSRNREFAANPLELVRGMYMHGSIIDVINSVLSSGNLPGEALGSETRADSYPFHVDFGHIDQTVNNPNYQEFFDSSIVANYGTMGRKERAGQIIYLYRRDKASWEEGLTYFATPSSTNHALIYGGMPATEITGIVTRDKGVAEKTKRSVLENGFYIPVYDISGQLVFTPEDYDKGREELNLSVPVEKWDYCLVTGGQKGSNPGAEMTISGKHGGEKYYVKFESEEEDLDELENQDMQNRLWNEQLADRIYAELGIKVPETKTVMVTLGSSRIYGHASKIIEGSPVDNPDVKSMKGYLDGFIADCLLGNWDVPYGLERNVLVVDGEVYRVDNGGSLIFRARGERKTAEEFGEKVLEIELGSDHENLGRGMRQEYPGLTDEGIRVQITTLKERLTDEKIDTLVDSVRLPKSDRDKLKTVIKTRRDYLIKRFKT